MEDEMRVSNMLLLILPLITYSCNGQYSNIVKAASYQDFRAVKTIAEKGADINDSDRYGTTALINGAYYGNVPIVKYLCEKGANVDQQNNDGRTALHFAAYYDFYEIAKILLAHNASTDIVDKYGYDAKHYAAKYARKKILALINIKEGNVAEVFFTARLYSDDSNFYEAKFTETGEGQGIVYGVLSNGEVFKGEYFTVTDEEETKTFVNTPWGNINLLSSKTDHGYQATHVTALGNNGTQIICVAYPRGQHGIGFCRDSHGKSYRLHY
jgi:hypothetical protein